MEYPAIKNLNPTTNSREMKINYQSIGSGGGIAQIKAKTVDFGASDEPLKVEDLDQAGLVQFPMVVGGVVPVVNIAGITAGQIKFTGDLLAQVFMGKIAKWNDPAIKNLNPGLNLPDLNITIVHRADGSGTTWLFTHYLSLSSPEWKEKVGVGKSVKWPAPNSVGGKGNEGVASYVKKVDGRHRLRGIRLCLAKPDELCGAEKPGREFRDAEYRELPGGYGQCRLAESPGVLHRAQ